MLSLLQSMSFKRQEANELARRLTIHLHQHHVALQEKQECLKRIDPAAPRPLVS